MVPKKSDLLTLLRERGRRIDREITQRITRESDRLANKKQRIVQLLPVLVRNRVERLARAAADLTRLSPLAQVARREEALRERGRRTPAPPPRG